MAEELTPDICVVGGGPAGVAAALAAAREGVPVVLAEKERMGGAWLNGGALASKALLAAAEARDWLRRGPAIGVTGAPLQVNLGRVRDHIADITGQAAALSGKARLTALGVTCVEGTATFVDERTVTVGETRIRARRFILATGATPAPPDLPGLDEVDYLTPGNALDLGRKPNHVLVFGAGPHGVEIAQALGRLGIDASVIDTGEALPGHDREHVDMVVKRLRAEGVRVRDNLDVVSVAKRRGGIRFVVREPEPAPDGDADADGADGGNGEDNGQDKGEDATPPPAASPEVNIDGSHLLVVGSARPVTEGLGLEAASVAHGPDGIVVDRRLRTTNRRVYAVGDATGGPYSVARARLHAAGVVRQIVYRLPWRVDDAQAVRAVFSDPGIAAVGIGQAEAEGMKEAVRILRYPLNETDRAHIERSPHGVVKAVVAAKTGRVLGATVVASDAAELIAPWSLAVARGLPVAAVAGLSLAHPTLSEASVGAAESCFGSETMPTWRRRVVALLRRFG